MIRAEARKDPDVCEILGESHAEAEHRPWRKELDCGLWCFFITTSDVAFQLLKSRIWLCIDRAQVFQG